MKSKEHRLFQLRLALTSAKSFSPSIKFLNLYLQNIGYHTSDTDNLFSSFIGMEVLLSFFSFSSTHILKH